jgi:hypothetical protein
VRRIIRIVRVPFIRTKESHHHTTLNDRVLSACLVGGRQLTWNHGSELGAEGVRVYNTGNGDDVGTGDGGKVRRRRRVGLVVVVRFDRRRRGVARRRAVPTEGRGGGGGAVAVVRPASSRRRCMMVPRM